MKQQARIGSENPAGAPANNTTVLIPPLRLSPYSYVPPGYDPLMFGKRRTVEGIAFNIKIINQRSISRG